MKLWYWNMLLFRLFLLGATTVCAATKTDHDRSEPSSTRDHLRRLAPPPFNQSKECILTKMVVHGKGSGTSEKDHDDETWYCELHDDDFHQAGKRFVKIEGYLKHDVLEFAKSGSSTLLVPGAVLLQNGSLVIPRGASAADFGKVERRGPARGTRHHQEKNKTSHNTQPRELAPAANVHKVVVVRVKANDSTTTASLSVLSDKIFGTFGDPVNLRERMASCSYGEVLMEPFVGTTTTGVVIANGVVQVNTTVNIKGRDKKAVADDVEKAVEAYLGTLATQFDHVILCIPPGSGTWTAFGKFQPSNKRANHIYKPFCNTDELFFPLSS